MSAVRELKEADAAYVAGLVDGIGDIDFTFGHIDRRRRESGRTYIQVSNPYRPVLEFLKFSVGGNIYDNPSKGPRSPGRRSLGLRSHASLSASDAQ
jgi:hypothetical protein